MPPAVRLSDICTGHGCYPPRPNVTASMDVFVNDRGQHRLADIWAGHCCVVCHGGVAASGSPNVFVNGRNACRITDAVSCGSFMATGSPNVFIN